MIPPANTDIYADTDVWVRYHDVADRYDGPEIIKRRYVEGIIDEDEMERQLDMLFDGKLVIGTPEHPVPLP